jgi:hypothetical protein
VETAGANPVIDRPAAYTQHLRGIIYQQTAFGCGCRMSEDIRHAGGHRRTDATRDPKSLS